MKTSRLTIAAARKNLAAAYARLDEPAHVTTRASLGHKIYNLEAGIRTRREHAARNARRIVEAMVAREASSFDKVTLRCRASGAVSSVYFHRRELVLVVHASTNQYALTSSQEAQLAAKA